MPKSELGRRKQGIHFHSAFRNFAAVAQPSLDDKDVKDEIHTLDRCFRFILPFRNSL